MRAYPGIADSPGSGTTAAGTLTYCQAELWIDPLLTAIEKADSQFEGIRVTKSRVKKIKLLI